MKLLRRYLWLTGVFGVVAVAGALDNLDSTQGRGWSTDSRWLAFTPGDSKSMIVVTPYSKKAYSLNPVGETRFETSPTFSSTGGGEKVQTATRRVNTDESTLQIASPGTRRLEQPSWAPGADFLAYLYEPKQRAIFSRLDEAVINTIATTNLLPWEAADGYRMDLSYETAAAGKKTQYRYVLRISRPDQSVARELTFETDAEIRTVGAQYRAGSHFLTPDKRQLVYPKRTGDGWQFFIEDVTGGAPARAISDPLPSAPHEWKLSPDGQALAVIENETTLTVGRLGQWAQAGHVTYSNMTLTVEWSGDGRYLAGLNRRQMWLLEIAAEMRKPVGELTPVYGNCSPQFWGWRGTRLFFNDADSQPGDLLMLDAAAGRDITPVARWNRPASGAPTLRSISPDGNYYACLFWRINDVGRRCQELWSTKLTPGSTWELVFRSKPTEDR